MYEARHILFSTIRSTDDEEMHLGNFLENVIFSQGWGQISRFWVQVENNIFLLNELQNHKHILV
jgi:hypothetical protein